MDNPEDRFFERIKQASLLYYQEKSGNEQKDPMEDMREGIENFVNEYLPSDFPKDVKDKTIDYVMNKTILGMAQYFQK